jgi:predicted small secreted protein
VQPGGLLRAQSITLLGLLRLSALALVACNALAGIGQPILESDGGATDSGSDAAIDANGSSEDSAPPPDSSGDANAPDASAPDTSVPDANLPDTSTPPPSAAAKPGFDLTAGGTYGASASYALIGVVGESPGGNNVGSSTHYVLKAGVIATTQPN